VKIHLQNRIRLETGIRGESESIWEEDWGEEKKKPNALTRRVAPYHDRRTWFILLLENSKHESQGGAEVARLKKKIMGNEFARKEGTTHF